MQLKTLLREYLEERGTSASPRYDFLPGYNRSHSLPVSVENSPWSKTGENERVITFSRRSDLQDFVNCYLELEEEQGVYAAMTIDGLSVSISVSAEIPSKFKNMIDEIAHETRGH